MKESRFKKPAFTKPVYEKPAYGKAGMKPPPAGEGTPAPDAGEAPRDEGESMGANASTPGPPEERVPKPLSPEELSPGDPPPEDVGPATPPPPLPPPLPGAPRRRHPDFPQRRPPERKR
ncbi:MAG: hypothetical protein HKO57_13530 [Akkermansiaceae bacterium]|nr:hypothetical protein [Akkermansiaceae bacterium]